MLQSLSKTLDAQILIWVRIRSIMNKEEKQTQSITELKNVLKNFYTSNKMSKRTLLLK